MLRSRLGTLKNKVLMVTSLLMNSYIWCWMLRNESLVTQAVTDCCFSSRVLPLSTPWRLKLSIAGKGTHGSGVLGEWRTIRSHLAYAYIGNHNHGHAVTTMVTVTVKLISMVTVTSDGVFSFCQPDWGNCFGTCYVCVCVHGITVYTCMYVPTFACMYVCRYWACTCVLSCMLYVHVNS